MRRGGGAGLAMRRGLAAAAGLGGASAAGLVGQANLIVQTRFGASSDAGAGAGAGLAGASAGFLSSLGPQANMMHRFLPRTASMFCSVFCAGTAFCSGERFSSSCETTASGRSNGLVLTKGNMPWKAVEGSGGLGVQGRVPGLVKPPSLVRSAVPLLLLQVETHDMPRTGLRSEWSSTGEAVVEPDLRAEVRSDSLRSRTSFDFVKDELSAGLCRTKGAGRWARGSGGSSRSATGSSSAGAMRGGDVGDMFCGVLIRNAACLLM